MRTCQRKKTYQHRWLVLCIVSLLSVNIVSAAPFTYTWDVRDLLASDGDTVDLHDDKGRLLKTLPTRQLLRIYAALKGIEKAAEVNAMLVIVDGQAPNAFATKVKGRLLTEQEMAKKREQQASGSGVMARTTGGPPGKVAEDDEAVEINLIGINFAMLDMLGDDMHMAAALIGHELGHIVLDHGEEARQKSRRTASSWRTAEATRYSRENEREADYIGTVWMVEAGFEPQAAVRLQELLYKSQKHRQGGFVGTHPSSTERIAILKSLARRLSR